MNKTAGSSAALWGLVEAGAGAKSRKAIGAPATLRPLPGLERLAQPGEQQKAGESHLWPANMRQAGERVRVHSRQGKKKKAHTKGRPRA